MSSMTSTGSLQAKRNREAEENQRPQVFVSPQRPPPAFTDPQRTSSSSFKPPMSRELLRKQAMAAETPPPQSSLMTAISYIKSAFAGRGVTQPPSSVSSDINSTTLNASKVKSNQLEVVKKNLPNKTSIDEDKPKGKENNQEQKITSNKKETAAKGDDEVGPSPSTPTLLEETKVAEPIAEVKKEKPARRKPTIPFSFDPKTIRPNVIDRDIKSIMHEKEGMQYLPPTILPSETENAYDKQKHARMRKIEQFKMRHMTIPPTILEPENVSNSVSTTEDRSDFNSKEFIFPPREIKKSLNIANRSPTPASRSYKVTDKSKPYRRQESNKTKSFKNTSAKRDRSNQRNSKSRSNEFSQNNEAKPFIEKTESGRTASYRIVTSPTGNATVSRSTNFSPSGNKKHAERRYSPGFKNGQKRHRSRSLSRHQSRSKSTPDRMFFNSRPAHASLKSKSGVGLDVSSVNKSESKSRLRHNVSSVNKSESKSRLRLDVSPVNKTESKSRLRLDVSPVNKSESKSRLRHDVSPVNKSESKSRLRHNVSSVNKSESKSRLRHDVSPVNKSESKSRLRHNVSSVNKSESKSRLRHNVSSVNKSESKSRLRHDVSPVNKSESKSRLRHDVSPVNKSESKSRLRLDVSPVNKSESKSRLRLDVSPVNITGSNSRVRLDVSPVNKSESNSRVRLGLSPVYKSESKSRIRLGGSTLNKSESKSRLRLGGSPGNKTGSKSRTRPDGSPLNKISSHTSLDDDRDEPLKRKQRRSISDATFVSPVRKSSSKGRLSPLTARRSRSNNRQSPTISRRSFLPSPSLGQRSKSNDRPSSVSPALGRMSKPTSPWHQRVTSEHSSIKPSPSKSSANQASTHAGYPGGRYSTTSEHSSIKHSPSKSLANQASTHAGYPGRYSVTSEHSNIKRSPSKSFANQTSTHAGYPMKKSPVGTPGRKSPVGTSGRKSPVGTSGRKSPVGTSGRKSPVGTSGRKSPMGTSGRKSPVGTPVRKSPVGTHGRKSPVGTPVRKSPTRPYTSRSRSGVAKQQSSPKKSWSSHHHHNPPLQPAMPSRSLHSNRQDNQHQGQRKLTGWEKKNSYVSRDLSSPWNQRAEGQSSWRAKNLKNQSPKQSTKREAKKHYSGKKSPPIKSQSKLSNAVNNSRPLTPSFQRKLSPAVKQSQEVVSVPLIDKEETVQEPPQGQPALSDGHTIVMTSPPKNIKDIVSKEEENFASESQRHMDISPTPILLEALCGQPTPLVVRMQSDKPAYDGNLDDTNTNNPCQDEAKDSSQTYPTLQDNSVKNINNSAMNNVYNEDEEYQPTIHTSWFKTRSSFLEEDEFNSISYPACHHLFLSLQDPSCFPISFPEDQMNSSNSSIYDPEKHDSIFPSSSDSHDTLYIVSRESIFEDVDPENSMDEETALSRNSIHPAVSKRTHLTLKVPDDEKRKSGERPSLQLLKNDDYYGDIFQPSTTSAVHYNKQTRRALEKGCSTCCPIKGNPAHPIRDPSSKSDIPLMFKNLKEVKPQGNMRSGYNKSNGKPAGKDIRFRSPVTGATPMKYRDRKSSYPPKQAQLTYGLTAAAPLPKTSANRKKAMYPDHHAPLNYEHGAGTSPTYKVSSGNVPTGLSSPEMKTVSGEKSPLTDEAKSSKEGYSSPVGVVMNTFSFISSALRGREKVPEEKDLQEATPIPVHKNEEQVDLTETAAEHRYSASGSPRSTFTESLKKQRPIPSWQHSKEEEPKVLGEEPDKLSAGMKDEKPQEEQWESAPSSPTFLPQRELLEQDDPDKFSWSCSVMGEMP